MASPSTLSAAATCFHCGLPIPPGFDLHAAVAGTPQPMCCAGCCAVAELLEAQGLSEWYTHRALPTGQRADLVPDVLEAPFWQGDEPGPDDAVSDGEKRALRTTTLLVEGLSCAACVWLIERHLERLLGVRSAHVDLASRRLKVEWSPTHLVLKDVIGRLAEIGFRVRPDRPDARAALEREEQRAALVRLGVSGLGAMHVMTYAVALYAGAFEGMADGFEALFRFASLLVATPVVAIAARPFLMGAVRDLRVGRPGMDVPVGLAIAGAYLVSAWATLRGGGEVYFDSVCMFTFFLSLGRYLEMRARHQAASVSRRLLEAAPNLARRLVQGVEQLVPAEVLAVGDRLVVRPGEALPADGRVLEGSSGVKEALLTGEPWPRSVGPGDDVIAGSLNTASPLIVEAHRVGGQTTLASILALMARAQWEKPAVARLADRVATVFVVAVLLIALGTAIFWAFAAPERAVWITLAVLIATCPCALGLATPAALAAATRGLAEAGLLVTRGHVLEGLATTDRVVFDKTGTLTRGEPTLLEIVPLRAGLDSRECLKRARRLEASSEHPLARALMTTQLEGATPVFAVALAELASVPGYGVEASEGGVRTRIGRPDWVLSLAEDKCAPMPEGDARSWVLLGDAKGAIAWFGFGDEIRDGTRLAIRELAALGLSVEMLSGDASPAAQGLAEELGIECACPAATPDAKVARLRALQRAGERVIMIGDGVNDGPVLAAAGVSIAMGSGSDLARMGSDAILLGDNLALLPRAIGWARRTRRVIQQNFAWAIAYNLVALPLAFTGQLAPWVAAAGMSASSLVVVFNAMRLQHLPEGSA